MSSDGTVTFGLSEYQQPFCFFRGLFTTWERLVVGKEVRFWQSADNLGFIYCLSLSWTISRDSEMAALIETGLGWLMGDVLFWLSNQVGKLKQEHTYRIRFNFLYCILTRYTNLRNLERLVSQNRKQKEEYLNHKCPFHHLDQTDMNWFEAN